MTGYKSKRAAALDEDGMYLVHQTAQNPVQVSVEEFVNLVEDKEHLVGNPIVWAQWPSEEKNNAV
jgi:hypothetical protein